LSKEIRDEINNFKNKNGNNAFTQKEMIMYLMQKIDKIHNRIDNLPCSEHMGIMLTTEGEVKNLIKQNESKRWIIGILLGVCITLFGWVLYG